MLKRFIAYYKPEKTMFFLDMGASCLVGLIGLVYPIVTRTMLNDLIPGRKYLWILLAGLLVLLLYLGRMGLQYFIQYQGHMMGTRMQAHMRSDMFRKLQTLPYSFYDENETGQIVSRLTNDLFDVAELAHHGPENLLTSTITIVLSFIYLCTINVWLTLIIFCCVPLMVLVTLLLRTKMREAFRESKVAIGIINARTESSIQGVRVTKAYNNAAKEQEKFEDGNSRYVEARRKSYKAMARFHSTTAFITDVFNVIVLIGGGIFLYNGKITFADYSAFFVSVNLFITPVTTLINFMEQYQNGVAGFSRFLEIMDAEPEKDAKDAADAGTLRGHIEFEHVTSTYDGESDVLKDVNLDIQTGKKYALVGPSGGGKTTICHLIPRFYDAASGSIRIDGKDIQSYSRESLRRNIGIVQQDIYLFNATVRENILYGRLNATEEEVIEAARRANIHDYIMKMPKGYDTVIGERGVKLSGGQKQRLSIARVFLKDPAILILDEATSALDNTTELLIQHALDELCQGRTTIVVAHRLSTIKNADEIAVISGGRIIEQGTHEELLSAGGAYRTLYQLQFRTDEEGTDISDMLEIG